MATIQVIGEEQNNALTQNIFAMAEQRSGRALQQARSQQFIEGKARVAQGEGLQEIKGSRSALDKIFGNATTQGAEAQTVIQAADKLSLYLNSNMEKFKSMPTEEFASSQGKFITENLMTGDKRADTFITLAASEVIAKASSVHAKHHELYKQQSSKLQFESTLDGSAAVLNQSLKDPAQSEKDKFRALQTTIERSQRQPGQSEEAYRSSLASVIVNSLKKDQPELYNGIVKGFATINGTKVDLKHDVVFDSATLQAIEDAHKQYSDRTNTVKKMDDAMSIASLHMAFQDLTVSDVQLGNMLKETLDQRGADLLTDSAIAGMFSSRATLRAKNTMNLKGIQAIADNTATSNPDRAKVAEDLGLYEQTLMQQVQRDSVNLSEGDAQSRMQNAAATVIQRSVLQQVVPPTWKARWNTGFANLLTQDGKPNPAFVATMQDYNAKHDAPFDTAKALYSGALDSVQLGNVEGVKLYMSTGLSLEQAIQHQASNILPLKEAAAFATGAEFQKKIKDFMADPDSSVWGWLFGSDWDGIDKNQAEMKQSLQHFITAEVASTGNTGESVFKAASAKYMKTHEPVKGKAVNNYGTPLNRKAGLRDPSVKFDGVIDYYLSSRGGETALEGLDKFGPGFIASQADIKVGNEYVTITPQGPDGEPLAGQDGIPRRISIAALGSIYNEEVTDKGILNKLNGKSMGFVEQLFNAASGGGNLPGTKGPAGLIKFMQAVAGPLEFITQDMKALTEKEIKVQDEEAIKNLSTATKESMIRTPGTAGKVAVAHAVQAVENVLGTTHGLLERIAIVESRMGIHPSTFNGVSNGIWQVDDIGLEDTRIMTAGMKEAYDKIKEAFGIDWNEVQPSDLQKPLYGALAARLYLIRQKPEIPESVEEQAEYWKKNYNKSGKGTPNKFMARLNQFK